MVSVYLSNYSQGRDNNFNLLRFLAATLVLYSHSFALTLGTGDAEPLRLDYGMTWGAIAVDVFFIASGFLIAKSIFSTTSFLTFTVSRVLRIYPALIVALFLSVFVMGAVFTTMPLLEYLGEAQTYVYFLRNSFILLGVEYRLPGVFESVPYQFAVNGSLWTLPYELKMYVFLVVLLQVFKVVETKLSGRVSVSFLFLMLVVVSLFLNVVLYAKNGEAYKSLHLFAMFFWGVAYYVYRGRVIMSGTAFIAVLIIVLVSMYFNKLFFYFYVLGLPYLVFYLAYVPAGVVRRFNDLGDYSYGIYIYAFPVQQSIVFLIPDISVSEMVVLSFFVTLSFAVASWRLVEKKALEKRAFVVSRFPVGLFR